LKSSVKKTHVCQSSLVDEQQQQISFNEQENQLINALVGIQGRGKSASPQQLNVRLLVFPLFLDEMLWLF
jgi:signal recognition particle GTPase